MAYDIDSIDYLGENCLIISSACRKKWAERPDDLPCGTSFIQCDECVEAAPGLPGFLKIVKPWWYGEGSGRTFPSLKLILGEVVGGADLLLCWEGGDILTGLRVLNGKVTEHKIVSALGEEMEG